MNHLHPSDIEQEPLSFLTDTLVNVLNKVSNSQQHSCLQVIYNSTTFFIHFNQGKLVYGTNSLAPFERLERHLRRLSNVNPKLDNSVIKQPRAQFHSDLRSYTQLPSDYQSIIWLTEQGHLEPKQTLTILRRITREVFESLLCIPDACQYRLVPRKKKIQELCQFNLNAYITQCQKRLEAWQVFNEKIWSSYQRPYLLTEKTQEIGDLTVEQNKTICKLLKGLNFRQISAILDLDELAIAKLLYPSMMENTIIVRDPKPPFDQLPPLPQEKNFDLKSEWRGEDSSGFELNSHSKQTVHILEKTWKVAYVDDDRAIHIDFNQCLDRKMFSLLTIEDPLNAFSELIEFEPDFIVLNISMSHLNGYELCTLLRNHRAFKETPIVLSHEAYEQINISKLKRSGATESIVKPFNRNKLLNLIFKYLQ
ncbi:response regulator [Waterburya agarophytonicola K14]|uniref:Response regulator n=1 Tax=Waterburya agarophytonicola KI4 TaxID=2874699 RepID=A0A964BNR0_9CYAN|nr:response regulator [Waterburya agarophytonicola]MCC0175718.1 response regulator [Waterburya agarophytonicola KI4]